MSNVRPKGAQAVRRFYKLLNMPNANGTVIENDMVFIKMKNMKHTIIALGATLVFISCKQKAAETNSNTYPTDTATYNNYSSDNYNTQGTAGYSSRYNSTASRGVYHRRTTYVSRSTYPAHTTVARKKGWSSAAKGAAIGAASGAVLGAVLSKDHHRAAGAVIGGAAGAAGGYLYGRHRDKKKGRY